MDIRPEGPPPESRGIVLFDGDCGICTSSAELARALVARRARGSHGAETSWRIEPYQTFSAAELAAWDLDEAKCAQYLRLVDAYGRVHTGAMAINRFLFDFFPWSLLVGLCYVFPALLLAEVALYEWVSRNRTAISSRLGLNACKVGARGPASGGAS